MRYSGVVTFVRSNGSFTPILAQDGFSGISPTNSRSGGSTSDMIGSTEGLLDEFSVSELAILDSEGRCVILDFGLFVLFNVYFPAGMDRREFKAQFHRALELRIRALVVQGREVILVGDINISHCEIDHCDPVQWVLENNIAFEEASMRKWMDSVVINDKGNGENENGILYDMFRVFHPLQEKSFSCWNTKIDARAGNYGTRIDYICATRGLKDLFLDCWIEGEVLGSDHAPVVCSLKSHDFRFGDPDIGLVFLMSNSRINLYKSLVDLKMNTPLLLAELKDWTGTCRPAPKLCSKNWDEFRSVRKISEWMSKADQSEVDDDISADHGESLSQQATTSLSGKKSLQTSIAQSTKKKPVAQKTLQSFFTSKPVGTPASESYQVKDAPTQFNTGSVLQNQSHLAYTTTTSTSKQAWSSIFAAVRPPPVCYHNEACKHFRVNKAGMNKGRVFFMCARPIGAKADETVMGGKGSSGSGWGRKPVGEFRCSFFEWKNGVKRKPSDEDDIRGSVG